MVQDSQGLGGTLRHAGQRYGTVAVIPVPEVYVPSALYRFLKGAFALTFASTMVLVIATGPYSLFQQQIAAAAPIADQTGEALYVAAPLEIAEQDFTFAEEAEFELERGTMTANLPEIGEDANPAPGSAKAYAKQQVAARGWSEENYVCLVKLWNKESKWNYRAENRSSGAYGIPQALPGRKMASAGSDWRTNPQTQIDWGLGYIEGRYSTPCGAWKSSQSRGWY